MTKRGKRPRRRDAQRRAAIAEALERGQAAHRSDALASAEAYYRRVLALDPTHRDAVRLLCDVCARTGRLVEVRALLENALDEAPDDAGLHARLGEIHGQLGARDAALACYRRALEVEPNHAPALVSLGTFHRGGGESEAALAAFERAAAAAPGSPSPHMNIGQLLYELGRYRAAAAAFGRAAASNPARFEALISAGQAHLAARDPGAAARCFTEAVSLRPDTVWPHLGLAQASAAASDWPRAQTGYEAALLRDPANVEAFHGLVRAHLSQGDFENALQLADRTTLPRDARADAYERIARAALGEAPVVVAERAIRSGGLLGMDRTVARCLSGNAHFHAGRMTEAHAAFAEVLAESAEHPDALHGLANVLLAEGRFEETAAACEAVIARDPERVSVYRVLCMTRKFDAGDAALLDRIESAMERPELPDETRAGLHFAAGKILDDMGIADRAFPHFRAGNDLRRHGIFDRAEHARRIDRLIAAFSANLFRRKSSIGSRDERPVFVVGMPRSGTTLVEQILASHPGVSARGELQFFDALRLRTREQEYPECIEEVAEAQAVELAEAYTGLLAGDPPAAAGAPPARITDKMPQNFLHLGLIALVFPRARVIHCTREPTDIVFSVYRTDFDAIWGNSYAYDLDDIVAYYQGYARLMAHWRAVLPMAMHEVRYEDLVARFEPQARALVAAVGLDWDAGCLAFAENPRPILTRSSWQARQPVYQSSVQGWRAYSKHLTRVHEALSTPPEQYGSG